MKNGVCPKCGKADVRWRDSVLSQRSYLPLTGWSLRQLKLDTYVCAACGHIEEYVRDEDLPRVAEKWPRVDPSDAKVSPTRK
jgi:predicted RNA-binding Zn-ribbon protein involved in translation (DUF1610 family)